MDLLFHFIILILYPQMAQKKTKKAPGFISTEKPRKPTTDSVTLRPAWCQTSAANSSSTFPWCRKLIPEEPTKQQNHQTKNLQTNIFTHLQDWWCASSMRVRNRNPHLLLELCQKHLVPPTHPKAKDKIGKFTTIRSAGSRNHELLGVTFFDPKAAQGTFLFIQLGHFLWQRSHPHKKNT